MPALAAVGGACGLMSGNAGALELGQIQVESTLGQPLRASIAYALNPNEQLAEYCITLKSGTSASGLRYLTRARILVANGTITLHGTAPMREPLLAMQMTIKCPYTAHLARSYTLMIDPAGTLPADSMPQDGETAARSAAADEAVPAHRARPAVADLSPVAANGRYQVQPGDSLSEIVVRITDRPAGLWPAAEAIFAANPDAFINGDKNLLKAGSWLTIPDLYKTAGTSGQRPLAGPAPTEPPNSLADDVSYSAAYSGYAPSGNAFDSGFASQEENAPETVANVAAGPVDDFEPRVQPAPVAAPAEAQERLRGGALQEMRPGDVFVPESVPLVAPIGSADGDAASVASSTTGDDARPVVASGSSYQPAVSGNSWSWLKWLAGSGVALIVGLLLFGRRIRGLFGSAPVGASSDPAKGKPAEEHTQRSKVAGDVDFQFDDSSLGEQSYTLDADLGAGTGLQDNSEIDVAQDFGFSATGDLDSAIDMEFPEGPVAEPEAPSTDIIPPHLAEQSSILESEVPPTNDSAEYDMSMIVDATKQALGEMDSTARDLMAVQVTAEREEKQSDAYTLKQQVEYELLEQDYQEEFTQTQALNEEIAKAALELAEKMDQDESLDETGEMPTGAYAEITSELTAQLPAASNAELTAELTANLPNAASAENEEFISDLDDTGINEELTAEMPQAGNDGTVEMEVEGGRVDTKKSRAS